MPPVPLLLALPDNVRYQELRLADALDPRSWAAVPRGGGRAESLGESGADAFFDDMVNSHRTPVQLIFVSVEQDSAGRHLFVSFAAALQALLTRHGDRLSHFEEAEVKSMRDESNAILLYARPATDAAEEGEVNARTQAATRASYAAAGRDFTQAATAIAPGLSDAELCPHSSPWARNYSVIPDLSLGPTQRLILCDEATLMRSLPEERIFESLKLIVNCHESRQTEGKYKVGSCSTKEPPKAIFQAVHEWHGLNDAEMNRVNDWIQQTMWEQLQNGTVAVHCLAGIHRAACIVACHYLWRYHTLGHKNVPCDATVIYQRLKANRPAVSPAYTHVLQKYEAHLKRQAAQAAKN